MLNKNDWKFYLMLALTFASVVVPIWSWQSDLSSKSIKLNVKSVAELQPNGISSADGVQVLIDGNSLNKPFVSVLQISNIGVKPILASEYEEPIKIYSAGTSKIVKARIMSSTPNALEPALSVSDGSIFVQPLLLNPGDTFSFTVITENSSPEYLVRARIAGVPDITVSDLQAIKDSKRKIISKIITIMLLVIYVINVLEFVFVFMRCREFRTLNLLTGCGACFGSLWIMISPSFDNPLPISSHAPTVASGFLIGFIFSVYRLMKKNSA